MDPIVYQPPAGRFANIPKTMSRINTAPDEATRGSIFAGQMGRCKFRTARASGRGTASDNRERKDHPWEDKWDRGTAWGSKERKCRKAQDTSGRGTASGSRELDSKPPHGCR
jgi:hypothetical protein